MRSQTTTLCLDEPDNFLALAEIQPLIFEFCDATEENGPQVIFASHHPETIDHPVSRRDSFSTETPAAQLVSLTFNAAISRLSLFQRW